MRLRLSQALATAALLTALSLLPATAAPAGAAGFAPDAVRPAAGAPAVRLHASPLRRARTHRVRLLLRFRHSTTAAARRRELRRLDAPVVRTIGPLGIAIVSVARDRVHGALDALRASGRVAFAEADGVAHATAAPNDPYYQGSADPCSGSLACWPYASDDLAGAWDATTGSSAVTVAVVDTGVDASAPDLAGAVLPGYNAITGTTDASDDNGHGTQVAGIIAARFDNGIGIPGVCGNCRILPVKVLDSNGTGYNSTVASGITWAADHGANVINLSLSSTVDDTAIQTAIDYAIGKGIVVAAAAGNAGSSSPTTSPGGYPAWNSSNPADPTAQAGLISVGATDYWDRVYAFSNYGSWVDVTASGCAISTTNAGGYSTGGFCGTSAATPFVSGVAALLESYDPALSPAEIKARIVSSTQALSTRALSDGTTAACSAADPCAAHGRLDALGALEAAGYTPPAAPSLLTAPQLSGSAATGQTLSVSDGTWSGSPTGYAYRWDRCDAGGTCSATGVSTAAYAVTAADAGYTLKATVTASNAAGSSSASAPLSPLVPGAEAGTPPAAENAAQPGAPSSGGGGGGGGTPDLSVSLGAGQTQLPVGGSDELTLVVSNGGTASALQLHLLVRLPSGSTLLGSPYYERGSGCTGSGTIDCNLDYLGAGTSTKVVLELRFDAPGTAVVGASVSADRDANPADNAASLTLQVGAEKPAPAPAAPTAPRAAHPPARATRPRGTVAVKGKALVGRRLRASYRGTGRVTAYHWQLCARRTTASGTTTACRTIRGATLPRLVVRRAFAGRLLRVVVAYVAAGQRHVLPSKPTPVTAQRVRIRR